MPKKLDQTAVPSSERGHGNFWYDKMDKQHSRGRIADCMILICLIECGYQKILGHLFACGVDVSFRAGPLFAEEAWPASADVALVQESYWILRVFKVLKCSHCLKRKSQGVRPFGTEFLNPIARSTCSSNAGFFQVIAIVPLHAGTTTSGLDPRSNRARPIH